MWCQHCAAVCAVSHVFRDEIEQQQGLGGRPSIHLDVRPDQVQAACALVRFVYTGEGGVGAVAVTTPAQQQSHQPTPLLISLLQGTCRTLHQGTSASWCTCCTWHTHLA